VLCLAFVAVCYGASPYCCTANQWTSLVTNWDPDRNFYFFGEIVYDYTNSRQYFTAMENDKGKRENVSYIMLHSKGMGYRYYNGGNCQNFSIPTAMPQACIPNDAIYRGNYSIGAPGALIVNVFEYLRGGFKGTYQTAAVGCVPVKNWGHSVRNPNVDEEEYFDYVAAVNSGVFTVPSFCPQ